MEAPATSVATDFHLDSFHEALLADGVGAADFSSGLSGSRLAPATPSSCSAPRRFAGFRTLGGRLSAAWIERLD